MDRSMEFNLNSLIHLYFPTTSCENSLHAKLYYNQWKVVLISLEALTTSQLEEHLRITMQVFISRSSLWDSQGCLSLSLCHQIQVTWLSNMWIWSHTAYREEHLYFASVLNHIIQKWKVREHFGLSSNSHSLPEAGRKHQCDCKYCCWVSTISWLPVGIPIYVNVRKVW